jgi:hypothetical protein
VELALGVVGQPEIETAAIEPRLERSPPVAERLNKILPPALLAAIGRQEHGDQRAARAVLGPSLLDPRANLQIDRGRRLKMRFIGKMCRNVPAPVLFCSQGKLLAAIG